MRRNFTGLVKLAQLFPNVPSVGDVLNRVNADLTIPTDAKHDFVSRINSAGLTVNQPGSRIPYVVGGAIAGHALAKFLGSKPFWDGVYTLSGALHGNSLYNKTQPPPLWKDRFQ